MKCETKSAVFVNNTLEEIKDLLFDLSSNFVIMQKQLLNKYDEDVNVEQFLNDSNFIKYLNKSICRFLDNE